MDYVWLVRHENGTVEAFATANHAEARFEGLVDDRDYRYVDRSAHSRIAWRGSRPDVTLDRVELGGETDVHGNTWVARIRAAHDRLGDACPCEGGSWRDPNRRRMWHSR